MTTPIDNFDELLARVAAGWLDDLTPEQVAALEAQLNATSATAQRLADIVPAPDPRLADVTPSPSAAEWNQTWERIDSATPARALVGRVSGRAVRLWRTVAAAAACLLLVVLWRTSVSPPERSWKIQLSDHVVVHELEVFGPASAFVAYSEDGSGIAMIWVFEENEEQGGA